jgi:choline kinase
LWLALVATVDTGFLILSWLTACILTSAEAESEELPTVPVTVIVPIFKACKDIGYDGEFCIEIDACKPEEDYVTDLREGRKFLEEKWAQS